MLAPSQSWELTLIFVIVGLDPTIQKFSSSFILMLTGQFPHRLFAISGTAYALAYAIAVREGMSVKYGYSPI
jgi:hypothetical protein